MKVKKLYIPSFGITRMFTVFTLAFALVLSILLSGSTVVHAAGTTTASDLKKTVENLERVKSWVESSKITSAEADALLSSAYGISYATICTDANTMKSCLTGSTVIAGKALDASSSDGKISLTISEGYDKVGPGKNKFLSEANETFATQAQQYTSVSFDENVDKIERIDSILGIEADFDAGASVLSGATDIVSTVIGIVVIIALVLTSLLTAVDIVWLSSPAMAEKMDSRAQGNAALGKADKNGEVHLRFVSREAIQANQIAQEQAKTPWLEYLKRRSAAIVLVAIVIFILSTGQITVITKIALKLVQGLLDSLSKFAEK